jgi:hypothetical protein
MFETPGLKLNARLASTHDKPASGWQSKKSGCLKKKGENWSNKKNNGLPAGSAPHPTHRRIIEQDEQHGPNIGGEDVR